MIYAAEEERKKIIDEVVQQIEANLPAKRASLVAKFFKRFYSAAAIEDLEAHSMTDLYGSILSLWQFMYERKPEEYKVRVYNPDYEQHGWQSTHTIVEIVHPDMPFLVDSIRMAINRIGFTIHFSLHLGKFCFERNENQQITKIHGRNSKVESQEEAILYFEIDRQTDQTVLSDLAENIQSVLSDVRVSVLDWEKMRKSIYDSIAELEAVKGSLDKEEFAETKDFLVWLEDHHFSFLGVRDYELISENGDKALKVIPGTGLGVLRDESTSHVSRRLKLMTEEARKLILSPQILIISKTNTESTVHRPIYTDYIGIKRFNKKGEVIGERRVIGLYTSVAYNTNPKYIPFLRRKVDQVIEKTQWHPKSHSGKVILNILETLPRDDLFQASPEELFDLTMSIYHLQERRRIRMFARKDVYGRFISCLVYVPRERFNTELRLAMQNILAEEFHSSEITFSTRFSESVLARIHFVFRIDPQEPREYDVKAIEQKLIDVARSWHDDFNAQILETYGEERGNKIINRYCHAFPASYREYFQPRTAVYDIKYVENITQQRPLEMNLYRPIDQANNNFRLKLYHSGSTVPLSDVLPILENMGMRIINERPFELIFKDNSTLWINDFGMQYDSELHIDIEKVKDNFQEAFAKVWFGFSENDGFNQLIFIAGLTWQEIRVLRAYAKYLKQAGFTFSHFYIEQACVNNPDIIKKLIKIFLLRFDPERSDEADSQIKDLSAKIQEDLDKVNSLDEDRILRRFHDLIHATLRTNYFQLNDGKMKTYLSFKFDPTKIPDLPLPNPMYEIFVYSARFEGVHLRAGKVARGGLRWSDRREDFRTEVLGLMKAQQVKNAVIVPAGAKGGFVPKNLSVDGTREEILAEGVACYKDFIRGLLDLTDNLKDGEIIPAPNVVRYDEDDHYLVVAADKGTATFSDIANGIADEYDFWLGDAFASGGSQGYDHKKMGITARGAWESVKRHFYELGRNTQEEDFTVVGIGDMAGDVFGNGMLLSKHIQLTAAFNHVHIFLDPNPDAAASIKERQRLFDLPRSSWSDYNPKLISEGGGVYSRNAKSIKLTDEVKKLLQIEGDYIVPNDLLKAILRAPVDLLWNGGIGTFVKGEHETHTGVGDRNNDAIRVNASELRVKVVGEGGNLGCTQQARVEFAMQGGYIYTDFIDNSAGVDCSDHEVNIKILLNDVVANGDMTEKQRNELLVQMTDEVADLVLLNNYRQTQAISLAAAQAPRNVELHSRYIQHLEANGQLDRSLEFLPDEKAIQERKLSGTGLKRPGIAVLLAYSKNILKDDILASDLPEDPYLENILETAFPVPLRQRYRDEMNNHSLKREIIATQLSSNMINQMGFTFIYRLTDETGAPVSAIVRAYTVARSIFRLDTLWTQLEKLDYKIAADDQLQIMFQLIRLTRRATRWFLRNRRVHFDIETCINEFAPGIAELRGAIPSLLAGDAAKRFDKRVDKWMDKNVPKEVATTIASTSAAVAVLDIIEGAHQFNFNVAEVAKAYFAIGNELDLDWLRTKVIAHPVENHWEALTREALRDDLDWQQRLLAIGILCHKSKEKDTDKLISAWKKSYLHLVKRWDIMLAELRANPLYNFIMFFVAIRELMDLTQTSYATANPELAKLCVTEGMQRPASTTAEKKSKKKIKKGDAAA